MFPNRVKLDDAQDNGFKRAIINMFKKLKKYMNKCWNEDSNNKNNCIKQIK